MRSYRPCITDCSKYTLKQEKHITVHSLILNKHVIVMNVIVMNVIACYNFWELTSLQLATSPQVIELPFVSEMTINTKTTLNLHLTVETQKLSHENNISDYN